MERTKYVIKPDLTIPKEKLKISKAIVSKLEEDNYQIRAFGDKIGMKHPQIVRVTSGENYTINTLLKILDGLDLEIVIQPKDK